MSDLWIYLTVGAICGGFINGLAGFGTSLFALGFWLQILPPLQAVSLVCATAMVTGLQGLWHVRASMMDRPDRFLRFTIPAVFGIPLGIYALGFVNPDHLKLLIAGFLIIYAVFFLSRGSLPSFTTPTPMIDRFIGFLGGILGGMAGLSGALPAMWCALRPWTKGETRAVMQPFNFVVLVLSTIILAWRGGFAHLPITQILGVFAIAIIAAQCGIWTFQRLTSTQFRWLIIFLMLASGVGLLLRTL